MEKRFDTILDHRGRPLEGVSILVKTSAGATATIYEDDGSTVVPNPLVTDENGFFEYYAADGVYSWTISYPSGETRVIPGIQHDDADNTDYWAIATGTGDAMVASIGIDALTDGFIFGVRAVGPNTVTTPTINVGGTGAKTIKQEGAGVVSVGAWSANQELQLRYNSSGDHFEWLNAEGGLREDLADPAGAGLIGYADGTVESMLDAVAKVFPTMADFRANANERITAARTLGYYEAGDGGGGLYRLDATDTDSVDNANTTVITDDGSVWKLVRPLTALRRYQVLPNKAIMAPDGSRFVVRGVSMFDYLLVSNETRTDQKYRSIYDPTGKGPGTGISEPTYYARLQYVSPANVETQLRKAQAMGVNLIRLGVEPAVLLATVSYVDPADGLTYPSDTEMMDEIVRKAGLLGMVVQLQQADDLADDSDTVDFLSALALRYWDCPWVWINPINEPGAVRNSGADVNNTAVWKARMDQYVPAIRSTLANGQQFLNPVVINPTNWGNNLNGVATTLNTDTVFTLDPNLIIGIHMYAVAGQADFRTTRLPTEVTSWYQYVDTYCLIIDEHGIDNYAGRYDPDLDAGTPSADAAEWARMKTFSQDFCNWVWERSTLHNLNGMTATMWHAYIPGLSTHDDNSLFKSDGTITAWGNIFKFYFSSHPVRSLDFRKSLGADATAGQWASGDILDGAIVNSKAGFTWTAWTPVVSAGSGTLTTATATGRYCQIGKLVFFQALITITTNGTGATSIVTTAPTTVAVGSAVSAQQVTAGFSCAARAAQGSSTIVILKYDGTYPGGSGAQILVSGFYEVP